jgi:leucyl aminopeptidase (aminopeptidase T)
MCRTHLSSGENVVVPQFLQQEEFIDELADTAADVGARFIEVCLVNSAQRASEMFTARESSDDPNHRAAKWLQNDPEAISVPGLYETMIGMVSTLPETMLVESIPGDPKQTLSHLRAAISQTR